jgi:hypothetical protein
VPWRTSERCFAKSSSTFCESVWKVLSARANDLQFGGARYRTHRDNFRRLGAGNNHHLSRSQDHANAMHSMPHSTIDACYKILISIAPSQDLPNRKPTSPPKPNHLPPLRTPKAAQPSIPQARHPTKPRPTPNRRNARNDRFRRPNPPHTHMLPLCTWSLDRCQRLIGERMMGLLAWRTPGANDDGFFDGLGLELLTRWLGMTPEAVRELTGGCERFIAQPENRIYVNLHTFTARRP